MNRKEYRRRKVANDYRRAAPRHLKLTVSDAFKETEVIQTIAKSLGPLSPHQRDKVYRMLQIAIEPAPKTRAKT